MDSINYNKKIIISIKILIVILHLNIIILNFKFYNNLKNSQNFFYNKINLHNIQFNTSLLNYSYHFQFNMAKVEYNIFFLIKIIL